jgi:hypothetical protein
MVEMRAGEIVGGLAVVGVFALIGLALIEDSDSATITTATTPTILAPVGSAPTTTASTNSEPTQPPVTDPLPSVPASTTTGAPTTTLPPIEIDQISVKVINGGDVEGAALFMTDVLAFEGFDPDAPADAVEAVDQTTVLYAPGREAAGIDVNDVVNVADEFLLEDVNDINWIEFGEELDVLVVMGPT